MKRPQGSKFVFGNADSGQFVLTREDSSTAVCGLVILHGATLVDYQDCTFDVVFDGS